MKTFNQKTVFLLFSISLIVFEGCNFQKDNISEQDWNARIENLFKNINKLKKQNEVKKNSINYLNKKILTLEARAYETDDAVGAVGALEYDRR